MSTIAQEHPTPARETTSGELYVDDFGVGQSTDRRSSPSTRPRSGRFAGDFDPRPFHLDEHAARPSFFGGLAASWWQTAAHTMRLHVQSELGPAGVIIGAGADELRWLRPVRPGDEEGGATLQAQQISRHGAPDQVESNDRRRSQ
jgi:acyl dehydratase